MKRFMGVVLILLGLWFYAWHLTSGGPPPHFLWAAIGAAVGLAGLWLVLSPTPKKQSAKADQ